VKRLVTWTAGTFLLFGLVGRVMERIGVLRCDCEPSCWCKRPGLDLFRWVVPNRHHRLPGPTVG